MDRGLGDQGVSAAVVALDPDERRAFVHLATFHAVHSGGAEQRGQLAAGLHAGAGGGTVRHQFLLGGYDADLEVVAGEREHG